jgi:hypothetical protein
VELPVEFHSLPDVFATAVIAGLNCEPTPGAFEQKGDGEDDNEDDNDGDGIDNDNDTDNDDDDIMVMTMTCKSFVLTLNNQTTNTTEATFNSQMAT